MEMEGAELAAVISRRDAQYLALAAGAGGADAGSGGGGDRRLAEPVDDDLKHRIGALGQLRPDHAAHARAIGQVARGAEPLVARAELRARADDTARERHDDLRQLAHRGDRPLGGGENGAAAAAENEEVAAADRLLLADRLLAEELAVHHGK